MFLLAVLNHFFEKIVDFTLVPATSISDHKRVLEMLQPFDNGIELIRLGAATDGGYLLPNDLAGIGLCISPGVANNWEFETDLLNRFGIHSLMLDGSIEPPDLAKGMNFRKVWLAPSNSENQVSLNTLIEEFADQVNVDLVLQMDIEGDEYLTLISTDKQNLSKFRIMVIEFHSIEMWRVNSYFSMVVSPLFERLLEDFYVVHIHPNNGGLDFDWHGKRYPSGLEVTFHRRDRSTLIVGPRTIPNNLDHRCDSSRPESIFPLEI